MSRLWIQIERTLTLLLKAVLISAVTLLVFDVVWGVFTRYVMHQQAKWTEELARFLLIWVALLGGAVAFHTRRHLGVDYFAGKLDPAGRKAMAIIVHLFVLIFAGAIFIYGGVRVVSDALLMEQTTPALGWKMGYVYLALPIAGFFMVIYTIEHLIHTLNPPAASERHEPEEAGGLD
jgi:TRAP-type C4-dicarboxylate transport system permease small subunit